MDTSDWVLVMITILAGIKVFGFFASITTLTYVTSMVVIIAFGILLELENMNESDEE